MVGEQIQNIRQQLQNVRGQFTMGQGLLSKLTGAGGAGILSNFQFGQRISSRIQSVRGMGMAGKTPSGVTTVSQHGVYQAPPATPSKKFVSV